MNNISLSNKNIILFGASKLGQITYNKLIVKYNIYYFCDNDNKKWRKYIYDVKIISPDKLQKIKRKIVIITSDFFIEIAEQLIKLNIKQFGIAYLNPKYDSNINEYIDDVKIKFYDYRNKNLITKNNKIALFIHNNSGSNTYLLNKMKPKYFKEKYEVVTINNNFTKKRDDDIFDVLTSNMVITTHSYKNYILKDKYNIKLWHGFPLKGIGSMSKNKEEDIKMLHDSWNRIDKVISYSQLYTTLINACFGGRISQYSITGMPRNDYIFNSYGKRNLGKLLDINLSNKKIVLYMPTFRISKYTKEMNGYAKKIFLDLKILALKNLMSFWIITI